MKEIEAAGGEAVAIACACQAGSLVSINVTVRGPHPATVRNVNTL